MELIPVEGDSSLFRDPKSGAILNCSSNDYSAYLQSKNSKIRELEEIDRLKSDVSEMKDMMKIILSKLDSIS